MAKKHVDWMKKGLEAMLQQFDQFTLKLPSYRILLGLTEAQVTAARIDYLWVYFAFQQVMQFEQECRSRVLWRDHLLHGPAGATAAPVPGIGTEFHPPASPPVPDGVLPRWRKLVEQIKASPDFTKAIGDDLGIEATESPTQLMKPLVNCKSEMSGMVALHVPKDGHDSVAVFCRRGAEPQPTLLGIFTSSRFFDYRPNLVPGQPELREYTAQFRDHDQPVGDWSDVCRVTTKP